MITDHDKIIFTRFFSPDQMDESDQKNQAKHVAYYESSPTSFRVIPYDGFMVWADMAFTSAWGMLSVDCYKFQIWFTSKEDAKLYIDEWC